MRLRSCLPLLSVLAFPIAGAGHGGSALASTAPMLAVDGAPLAGAVVGSSSTVTLDGRGAVSAKFVLDGTYLGNDTAVPLQWPLRVLAGEHVLKVRVRDARGVETRAEATFTAAAAPAPAPQPTPLPAPAPVPAPDPAVATVVRTPEELRRAVTAAAPGAVITVADDSYVFTERLVASASGTAGAPITLRGSRDAVLRSTGVAGDYGLSVTGSYWRIQGLTVADASKGVVLDGSVGTVIDGVDVHDIGAEGVHFRTCSSDSVLRNSTISRTGLSQSQYGEGVYVGSASSNWGRHGCQRGEDGTHRVLVEGNVFRDVPAEGADIKEGTRDGVLRGNLFERVGYSGANSADSAVDVKGNGWLVERNTVTGAGGRFLDAFQTHGVVSGWGTGNTFRSNAVEGPLPGYGFGLFPSAGNIVACSNVAPGALKGLSSLPCR